MNYSAEQSRLIAALVNMFQSAAENADKTETMPQACAFLLSTGHIAGGVAMNPVSIDNPDAEDPVLLAVETANRLPGLGKDFKIVGLAMTTLPETSGKPAQLDVSLYEQSFVGLTNLATDDLLLVDPETSQTIISETFAEYGFAS